MGLRPPPIYKSLLNPAGQADQDVATSAPSRQTGPMNPKLGESRSQKLREDALQKKKKNERRLLSSTRSCTPNVRLLRGLIYQGDGYPPDYFHGALPAHGPPFPGVDRAVVEEMLTDTEQKIPPQPRPGQLHRVTKERDFGADHRPLAPASAGPRLSPASRTRRTSPEHDPADRARLFQPGVLIRGGPDGFAFLQLVARFPPHLVCRATSLVRSRRRLTESLVEIANSAPGRPNAEDPPISLPCALEAQPPPTPPPTRPPPPPKYVTPPPAPDDPRGSYRLGDGLGGAHLREAIGGRLSDAPALAPRTDRGNTVVFTLSHPEASPAQRHDFFLPRRPRTAHLGPITDVDEVFPRSLRASVSPENGYRLTGGGGIS